jgi:hypothetical protein
VDVQPDRRHLDLDCRILAADVKGVYGTQGTAAANNEPGARNSASAWTNHAGGFWVFGGQGFDSTDAGGLLNDLWEYVP